MLGRVSSNWKAEAPEVSFAEGQVKISPLVLHSDPANKASCLISFSFSQPIKMARLSTKSNAKFFELSIQPMADDEFKYLGTHRGVKEEPYFTSTFTTPPPQRRGQLHGSLNNDSQNATDCFNNFCISASALLRIADQNAVTAKE